MGLRKLVSELLREKWLLCKLGSTAKQQTQSSSCNGHPTATAAASFRNQWQTPLRAHGMPGPSALLRQLHQTRAYSGAVSSPSAGRNPFFFQHFFPSHVYSAGRGDVFTGHIGSTFATAWSRRWMARALGTSVMGAALLSAAPSPLLQLIRMRLTMFAQQAMRMQPCPIRGTAWQLFHHARHGPAMSPFHHGIGRAGMSSNMPRWGSLMRHECAVTRWAFVHSTALSRGYATAISRCAPFPPPVQVFATATGRMFTMPLACLNSKMVVPLQNDNIKEEDELSGRSMMVTYAQARTPQPIQRHPRTPKRTRLISRFAPEHRPLPVRRAGVPLQVRSSALPDQPSTKHAPIPEDEPVEATLIVPQQLALTAEQPPPPPPEEITPKVDVLPVMQNEGTQTEIPAALEPSVAVEAPVCDVPANSRFCVSFVLPGPQIYEHLVSAPSANSSNASVLGDQFLDRLSDVMALNNHQLSLVSSAIAMLREQFPHLDVRLHENYVRVFIPLGTPTVMVRNWLSQAGLREGEQFLIESTASLRDGSSRTSSVGTGNGSSRVSKLTLHSLPAARSSVNNPRDIHTFLAKADAMARDNVSSFGRMAVRGRSPVACSAAERLAAARDYSQSMMSFL